MLCLKESRKYKTLSSIPKDSKEYICLKNQIQIEELLISPNSTNSKDFCYNQIKSILQNNKENGEINKSTCEYLIDLLIYAYYIRRKDREFQLFIITKLISDFQNYKKFIILMNFL